MAAYLGQIIRITRNDGYVPQIDEYKLNGKKQVEEFLSEMRRRLILTEDYRQRNDIWERDGSYWSVWDFVGDDLNGSWFEVIIVRAVKL